MASWEQDDCHPRHQYCIQNHKTNSWLGRGTYFLFIRLSLFTQLASQKPHWPELGHVIILIGGWKSKHLTLQPLFYSESHHEIRDLEVALGSAAAVGVCFFK